MGMLGNISCQLRAPYLCSYNFLMYVPYQLERLIQLGTLLCLDSFLAIITIMPYRAVLALLAVLRGCARR